MPMLADLEDPPAPRWRSLVLGVTIALPIAGAFLYFALPALRTAIVGESESFDARLRQEDAYMKSVCSEAMVLERDESLCKCALAVEFPALDCRAPFMEWTLHRQVEQCIAGAHDTALAFCACTEALAEQLTAAEQAGDDKASRQIVARYAACAELDDALFLPSVESLVVTPSEG